jgi:glutamyl/glutaminyl-tRNA synthetase
VEGKVVTRFPPQPSGYLHIGHIKAVLLNIITPKYTKVMKNVKRGKMILRFDDINPVKEKKEFVDSIMEDLKAMGVEYDRLTYTSDYFDQILDFGKRLIEKGLAYVDNTPLEQIRDDRGKRIESKNCNLSIEDNLKIFAQMIKGKADDYALRAKIDMKSLNSSLRDRAIPNH